MKRLTTPLLAGIALLSLASCADENPWSEGNGTGHIRASLVADGSVKDAIPTRTTLQTPDVAQFGIRLSKSDGTYSNTWNSLSDFTSDLEFASGDYTLEAFYGKENDEGYDKPYFYGKQDLTVSPSKTTDVDLEAILANTMVSVKYTDAFLTYFSSFSTTLHSEGGQYVTLQPGNDAPVHLIPGEVTIEIGVTLPSGKTTTIAPAKFDAEACHHYQVTLNVFEGEVGTGTLQVIFNDNVQQESVEIDLSEELLETEPPVVTLTGSELINQLEGMAPENASFNVFAAGGIQEAIMTITADDPSYAPAFGKEIDLCSATDLQKSQLESAGIKAMGFFKNPDQLAKLDLSEFIAGLKKGTYHFSLKVKDKLMRVNEGECTFSAEISEVTLQYDHADNTPFLSTSTNIYVNFNGSDFSKVKVEGKDDYGNWTECPITATQAVAAGKRTRSVETQQYKLTITIPQCTRSIQVRLKYNNVVKDGRESNVIMPDMPTWDVAIDAYSKYADLKITVNTEAQAERTYVMEHISVMLNNKEVSFTRDDHNGVLQLNDLTPSTSYTVKTSIDGADWKDNGSFTTEGAAAVPNGDFETLTQTYNVSKMNQGGQYKATAISETKQNLQSYTVSEPNGWASINKKTANLSAKNQNSWFVVLSTYNSNMAWESLVPSLVGNGTQSTNHPAIYQATAQNGATAMVVRSVAWDHNGTTPGRHTQLGATPDDYYNHNAPNIANASAGELFLGNYSFSGSETRSEGVAFTSRPAVMTGYYKYAPNQSSENGVVEVALLNGTEVIATTTVKLSASNDYQQFSVPLTYNSNKKATTLKIGFKSTDASNVPTTKHAEKYLQEAYGAVLVVDNLAFSYDRPGQAANKKHSTKRRK